MKRVVLFIVLTMAIIGLVAAAGNQTQQQSEAENLGLGDNFPVAYVKDGTLYFFNPENEEKVQFTEETDTVFNCAYSDADAMFYYTVSRNGKLSLKQVDLSVTHLQPELLHDLRLRTGDFLSETFGEKAKLMCLENHVFLQGGGCEDWKKGGGFYGFIDYSIKDNGYAITDNIPSLGGNPFYPGVDLVVDESVFEQAENLDFSQYPFRYPSDGNKREFDFMDRGESGDGSKVLIALLTYTRVSSDVNSEADEEPKLYIIANSDGTMMKVLDHTNDRRLLSPLWSDNNLVYLRYRSSETGKEDGVSKQIAELCYTRASDNMPKIIDCDVDYFAVRKQQTDW